MIYLKNFLKKKINYDAVSKYDFNSDESFSEELDEDDLGIISIEMSGLFNTVIELKNTIEFTLDKNSKYDSQSLIKYLNSTHMFAKVQNSSAEKISESNLASLLLNFKKFNYAVYHLKKCLINSENYSISKLTMRFNPKVMEQNLYVNDNIKNEGSEYNLNSGINDKTKKINIHNSKKNLAHRTTLNNKETFFKFSEKIGNLNFSGKNWKNKKEKEYKNIVKFDIKHIKVKDLLNLIDKNFKILEEEIKNKQENLNKTSNKLTSILSIGNKKKK